MRIYLDTNILLAEGWPRISVKLREMLTLARGSQISVVLPEAVEREVKAHWLRDLEEQLTELTAAERHFGALTSNIGWDAEPTTKELFDLDSAGDKYIEVVDKLKSEWCIISAPLNPVPLDGLFQMAITKQPPFEDRGTGFQDAVILLSAIEDLALCSTQRPR